MGVIWIDSGRFAAPASLLLDTYTGAAAAYSLRQLRTGVTNVVRVRRSSDNTQSNFTASQINDGSLAAWVGAGANGFVSTWYDQTENGNNATQTTTIDQPQIVNNGSLIQTNGKTALDFNGASQRLNLPTIGFSMNSISVNVVAKADTSSGQIGFSNPDPNRLYMPLVTSGVYYVGYAGLATAFNFGSSSLTSQYLIQLNAGSSTANAWRNGIASTSVPSSSVSEAGAALSIGSYRQSGGATSSFWDGTIQEVIFYISDKTSSQAGIASNINAHYAIY